MYSVVTRPPFGPLWVHEIKHDGYRLMVLRDGSRVHCFTRNGHDCADRFRARDARAVFGSISLAARCLPFHRHLKQRLGGLLECRGDQQGRRSRRISSPREMEGPTRRA